METVSLFRCEKVQKSGKFRPEIIIFKVSAVNLKSVTFLYIYINRHSHLVTVQRWGGNSK